MIAILRKIGIITDVSRETVRKSIESKYEDEQKNSTLNSVKEVLEKKYEVEIYKADESLMLKLKENRPDLVFNLSSGIVGESRQSQVPAILEMLQIPYTGSGILTHSLALHKGIAKKIFMQNQVPTPRFQLFTSFEQLLDKNLKFPLIVKPSMEGSGIGVHKDSLVYNEEEFYKVLKNRLELYEQSILVEEFIEGREFTVGILGNEPDIMVLPIMEISFDRVPEDLGKFYTFETKTKMGHLTDYICPAKVSVELEEKIKSVALRAYKALECRDISRVDVRVREDKPYVLEINTLPGLKKGYSDLPKMAEIAGFKYDKLIDVIIKSAAKRYGLI
ncbi:D-alanine--D-alanine ligase family protein [Caminicella sporogenes]|uniref:D-alanine--D-alanine ligase family protein n=1 Tax=Caminicella sporogenes TaxID=166485 RepID=UPI002541B5D7|nr:ATP-grasp domain-containing protein [Caminicella sporogenes]WIF95700.1 ATP-grasp domain-containing protein [Caminicella sporogenes]